MTYREQSYPVIKIYEASGQVQRVDSSKGSPEEVFAATKGLFAGLIPGAAAGAPSGAQAVSNNAAAAPKSSMSRFLGAPFQHGHAKEQVPKKTKPKVVFVLGGPGSGKGTICAKLSEAYSFLHVSTGDLLRAEVAAGGRGAEEINGYMKEGKIVPSEVTVRLLKRAIDEATAPVVLVDGFPRAVEQVRASNDCFACSRAITVNVFPSAQGRRLPQDRWFRLRVRLVLRRSRGCAHETASQTCVILA